MYTHTQNQCQVYKQTEKAVPQSQILSYGDVPRNPITRSLYNIQTPFNSRSRDTKKLVGGEPLLLPGLGSPSHTSRKASGHLTWVMVTIQGAHPHHHRHGWTRAEQGNFGLPVPTWREGLSAGLSLSPPDAALGPRAKLPGFSSLSAPSQRHQRDGGVSRPGGRRNHPRNLLSPLPRRKELGGQGRDCNPEGPTGHGGPHGGGRGQAQGHRFPTRVQPARTACAPAPPANPNPWGLCNLPVTRPEERPVQPRLRAGPQRPPAVTGPQSSQHAHLLLTVEQGAGGGSPEACLSSLSSPASLTTKNTHSPPLAPSVLHNELADFRSPK